MKKILTLNIFLAILFLPAWSNAQIDPIECSSGSDCTSSASCGGGTYCWIAPPAMPGGQGATSGKCIPNNSFCTPPSRAIGGGGEDNKKEETKKETSEDPCDGILIPPALEKPRIIKKAVPSMITWRELVEPYLNPPTEKKLAQKASPLPAGPTTNGFSAGAGIVAGEPTCTYIESPEEVIVNTCAKRLNTQRSGDGSRDSYIKKHGRDWYGIYWDDIQKECGRIIVNGVATYPKPGKMSCTTANVFDALWGFLTHRKIY